MSTYRIAASNFVTALFEELWSFDALLRRAIDACRRKERWHRPLIRRLLASMPEKPAKDALSEVVSLVESDEGFRRGCRRQWRDHNSYFHRLFWAAPAMTPAAGPPSTWHLPSLTTPSAVAEWLGLTLRQLDWFTDCMSHERLVRSGRLRHYHYRWLRKSGGKWRLLEIPKSRLRGIQRRLLHEILDVIPPHDAAQAYRRGRSLTTFVAPHCGQRIVVRFDLRHFFPSVRHSRIHALFTTAGFPPPVAQLLTGFCTNVVPDEIWQTNPEVNRFPIPWQEQHRYRSPHLPQGAPTSPALANLCCYRLDCRLHGLGQSLGARYTRYADDLAFSGGRELERALRHLRVQVSIIAMEEGFEVNLRKSAYMRQGTRQRLTGVVVNSRPNLLRSEFDRLKAILHNSVERGPASQNRDSHGDFRAFLLGRIAHVGMLNPSRGQKLRAIFERIDWTRQS